MKKEIAFERDIIQIDGEPIEVLNITQEMKHLDMSDDKCCLCGLKIRNGKHSFAIHKANVGNADVVLLPVEPQSLWNNLRVSQGASAIGSECRKQLPAEFTINTTSWFAKAEVK